MQGFEASLPVIGGNRGAGEVRWRRAMIVAAVLIVLAAAGTLLAMGRVPWCSCGTIKLWHGVVQSSENSQHLTDWYTPSHIIHGFLFYGAVWLFGHVIGRPIPIGWGLVAALLVESAWEIFENTDFVVNRYRETTIALHYYGDSVVNSVCDILAMMFGFILASRLPILVTIIAALLMEIVVGYWIHDNLTLNVLMLLYPIDAIKAWQTTM
jgi:hypothetical protein